MLGPTKRATARLSVPRVIGLSTGVEVIGINTRAVVTMMKHT